MRLSRFTHFTSLILLVLSLSLLSGCASNQKQKEVYNKSSEQVLETVQTGVVTEVNDVMLAGQVSPIGNTTVGVLGQVAGASAGGSSGAAVQILATLGGMIGSILGASAEEAITRKPGQEIYVKLDDSDETVKIVQVLDQPFKTGDMVRVIQNGSKSRVERYNASDNSPTS